MCTQRVHRASCSPVAVSEVMTAFGLFLENEKGLRSATITCYGRHVTPFLAVLADPDGLLDLGQVLPEQIQSYVTSRGCTYAPQSLKLVATSIRAFLRYCEMSGRMQPGIRSAVGPVITHRFGQLPKALDRDELQRLLSSPNRSTAAGSRDYALLLVLSRLGLRAGEAASLRLGDVNWRTATITPRVKGGGRLCLPLPIDVGHAIVDYLRHRPRNTDAREVFLRLRGGPAPMTRGAVTQVVARHASRVGLGIVHAHRLRHSAARAVLCAGGTLPEVGHLLGHTTDQVTTIYASLDLQSLSLLVRPWPVGVRHA